MSRWVGKYESESRSVVLVYDSDFPSQIANHVSDTIDAHSAAGTLKSSLSSITLLGDGEVNRAPELDMVLYGFDLHSKKGAFLAAKSAWVKERSTTITDNDRHLFFNQYLRFACEYLMKHDLAPGITPPVMYSFQSMHEFLLIAAAARTVNGDVVREEHDHSNLQSCY